jgi:hypothetical protein
MRSARVSAVLALAAIAATSPALLPRDAAALEPGVHIDPGSPAAKEYALPVNQARGTGSGGSGGGHGEGSTEKLFGAGIKPPSSGSSGPASAGPAGHQRPRTTSPRSGSAGAGGASSSAQAPPVLVRRAADTGSGSAGGSSALVLLAGGMAVLALGGFAGIVLRHNRRPTSAR